MAKIKSDPISMAAPSAGLIQCLFTFIFFTAWSAGVEADTLNVPGGGTLTYTTTNGNRRVTCGIDGPETFPYSSFTSFSYSLGTVTNPTSVASYYPSSCSFQNGVVYTATPNPLVLTLSNGCALDVYPNLDAPSVTPTCTVPGPPISVWAAAGNASATVHFVAPSSNGGEAITGYTVTSSPGGLTASGPGSPLVVTGLTNLTKYTFTATATNVSGTGPPSTPSPAITPAPPPTVTLNSVGATWLNPGDPEIIAVEASASDIDGIASVQLLLNGSSVQTLFQAPYNFQVVGIGAGTYSVAALATNTALEQTLSAAQNVTVGAAPPVTGDPKSQTRTTKFEYDPNTGRMTKKMTEPEDSNLCLVQTYTYDSFGNLASTTTRNCNSSLDSAEAPPPAGPAVIATRTSTVNYDTATGTFPTGTKNALSQSTSATFDDRFGTMLTQYDLNNLETQQTPDVFGRVVLIKAPDQTQSKMQYLYCSGVNGGSTSCPAFAVTAVQATPFASDGVTQIGPWKMTFNDVLGRAIETQTQGFNGTVVAKDTLYDSLGRVHQVSRPYFAGSTAVYSTNTYDVLGRILSSIDPNNDPPKTYTYNGLETSVTDANGHTTTKVLNGQHLVTAVIDAMDQVMSYEYDPFGNLIRTTDAAGITKTYLYDVRGRETQVFDSDMGTWTYVYDSLGELVQQTDAKSQVASMSYDLLGRMTSRTEAGMTSNWEYDTARSECSTGAGAAIGQLDRAWTTVGPAYSRIECYDSLERGVQERTQIGGTNTYVVGTSYDPYSRVQNQTYPAGFVYPAGFSVTHMYNSYGYLSELVNASNGSAIWQANTVDATGHILSDSMGAGSFTATRVYDVLDRLKSVQVGASNTIQNDGYAYDAVGNLQQRSWIDSSDVAHSENFGYDALNRLTSVTGPASKTYQYDDAGNLIYKSDVGTYSYTAGTHQISAIAGTVNTSFMYDVNGNIQSEAGLAATWTSFNMPTTLTRGASSSSFVYGPEHQRTQQVAQSSSGTVTTYYVGSSFERVVTSATGITENHYHVSAQGRRIAMLVDASNSTTSWRYFHQDLLSSVEVVTDQAGALVERLSYDSWGRRRNLDGTDSATQIVAIDKRGYTDQEELDSLGVIDMNARIYDPIIARFISPDPTTPSLYDPQSHGRYTYTRNRPLAYVDPTGFVDEIMDDQGGGGGSASAGSAGVGGAGAGGANAFQDTNGSSNCTGLDCAWTIGYGAYPGPGNSSTTPTANGAPANQQTGDAPGNQPSQDAADVMGTNTTPNTTTQPPAPYASWQAAINAAAANNFGAGTQNSGAGTAAPNYFNDIASPERADAESTQYLVENYPDAARISGYLGLCTALCVPAAAAATFGASAVWSAGLNGGSTSVFFSPLGSTAQAAAEASGGTTIAQTPIGYVLNALGPLVPRAVWNYASATFAMNAEGTATAFLSSPAATTAWNTIELPILTVRNILIDFVAAPK